MVKATLYDVTYDTVTQDFAVSGGDLAAFTNTYAGNMDQLLVDAMESQFNSMKHIMRNHGFEGRNDSYTTTDNTPKQQAYLYVGEILSVLSFLFLTLKALTPTFTATGFTMALEFTMADFLESTYSKTLTWNQNTTRASVA